MDTDTDISNTTDTTESFTDTTESFTDINESFTEDDKDETLIAAVKRNPAIWNHMDKDYKSRDLKPQLWTLIASEVKQSGRPRVALPYYLFINKYPKYTLEVFYHYSFMV